MRLIYKLYENPSLFQFRYEPGGWVSRRLDARAVHFQKPYMGEAPFLQVLLNIKVERLDG